MAQNTAIQWCDSTENPTMGCAGCELWSSERQTCYAGVLHQRFGGVAVELLLAASVDEGGRSPPDPPVGVGDFPFSTWVV